MPPRAAPAHFPYDHGSLAQNDTRDPRAWHLANKARFDALYGRETAPEPVPAPRRRRESRAARLAAARQWRINMKPHFDALYGPETQA